MEGERGHQYLPHSTGGGNSRSIVSGLVAGVFIRILDPIDL